MGHGALQLQWCDMKGIVLAGGTGSRLAPLTNITNKHLLPIYDRPMIYFALEALVRAGLDEIMVVTGGNHAGEFLRLLGNGGPVGLRSLQYAYQERPGGIAQALGLAEHFAAGDKVVVMLGDNIVEDDLTPVVQRFEDQQSGARLLLKEMADPAHLQHLGVAVFDGGPSNRLTGIEEKPADPPSRFAVIGVYFYPAEVFDVVRSLTPSGRGELEITDVNNSYLERGQVEHDVLSGFWGDAGESIEAYHACTQFARSLALSRSSGG